jgi:hypothetical protein
MTVDEIRSFLIKRHQQPISNITLDTWVVLSNEKVTAIRKGDQERATYIWALEQIATIQDLYLFAISQLKKHEYYESWCTLADLEIQISHFLPHCHVVKSDCHIAFIARVVKQLQSIYPYRIFQSGEIVHKKEKCSICDKVLSLRNPCGHIVGNIYDGKCCRRIVLDVDFVGVSLTENPGMKKNVVFLLDEVSNQKVDHYDYSVVQYFACRLESPWANWQVEKSVRFDDHKNYKKHEKSDRCPCGSGKKYGVCCRQKRGVAVPHFEFIFSWQPKDTTRVFVRTKKIERSEEGDLKITGRII